MRILVILAHPLKESFAAAIAEAVKETLEARGHSVDFIDLYAEDFDPRLTIAERGSYFSDRYDLTAIAPHVARLRAADGLIMVFPQWWFNLPAILKGYIDRVFVPGVAFAHDLDSAKLIPKLVNIKHFWAISTTGSPWWVVHFYMGNPVCRLLKRGVAAFCAKKLDFRMLSLHDMDRSTPDKRAAFLTKVRHGVGKI